MTEIFYYSLLYLLLFGFTDLLYHKLNVQAENTRKIVHICTGLIALSFPVYLKEIWQVALLCSSFLGLMALSERFSWFKSITAIKRKSHGSWSFSLSVLLGFIAYHYLGVIFFYLPLLVLTLADPMAAIVGKKLDFKPVTIFGQTKTVGGSLAFFVTAILGSFAYCEISRYFLNHDLFSASSYWRLIIIALVATVAEFSSTKGWDNLTVPLSVMATLYLYMIL